MIISHVKIIAFQLSLFCKNYRFSKTVLYIINRIIHGCLEIPYLFLVLNMISHSFAALTREISCSTLEINMVFPRTHVLFSIYLFLFIFIYFNFFLFILFIFIFFYLFFYFFIFFYFFFFIFFFIYFYLFLFIFIFFYFFFYFFIFFYFFLFIFIYFYFF